MTTTANLNITHAPTLTNPVPPINEGLDAMDLATQDTVDVACGAGGTITVSQADFTRNVRLKLTGSPGAAFTLSVPQTKRDFIVQNATAKVATVQTAAPGVAVEVAPAERWRFYSDGTDLFIQAAGAVFWPIFIGGVIADDVLSAQLGVPFTFTIKAGAPLQVAVANTPSDTGEADRVFELYKNASQFGTVTFADTVADGVFSISSDTTFARGDRLSVVNPTIGSPATLLADVSITLRGALP